MSGRNLRRVFLLTEPKMKRRLIAACWVMGATVPLLLATLFVVGCCVLPFHGVMHKLMPICEMAASMMRGDHTGHDEHNTIPPSREKQEPVKRIATVVPSTFRLIAVSAHTRVAQPSPSTRYRSFITHGAVRCDRDVGLHVLVETFLI